MGLFSFGGEMDRIVDAATERRTIIVAVRFRPSERRLLLAAAVNRRTTMSKLIREFAEKGLNIESKRDPVEAD